MRAKRGMAAWRQSSVLAIFLSITLILTGLVSLSNPAQATAAGLSAGKYGSDQVFSVSGLAATATCSGSSPVVHSTITVTRSGLVNPVSLTTGRYVSFFETGNNVAPWGAKLFDSAGSELRLNGSDWISESTANGISPAVSFGTLRLLSSSGTVYGLASEGFIYSGADVGELFVSNAGPLTTDVSYSPSAAANDCLSLSSIANQSFASATYVANSAPNTSLGSSSSMALVANIGNFGLNQTIAPVSLKASGSGTYTYAISTGSLPAGLSLNTSTGLISGRPTSAGAYSFEITASENAAVVDTQSYTGTVFTFVTFENGALRFGNGSQHSVNAIGLFEQPFYWSRGSSRYFKLTYSTYPLDMAIGTGAGGSNWSGSNVVDLGVGQVSSQTIDYSGYTVLSTSSGTAKGYGRITVTTTFTINSQSIEVRHVYTLGQTDNFVKIETTSTNKSASTVSNMHIWVGTRDDYVGSSDSPTKTKGNLDGVDGAFQAVPNAATPARALQITTSNEGALFYSTTAGTDMSVSSCCSFSNAYNTRPSNTAVVTGPADGSYAAVLPVGNLAVAGSVTITWFYAAGALQDLGNVAKSVAAAAAPPAPTVVRGDQTASLSWLAPEIDPAATIIGYNYRVSTDGGSTWTTSSTTMDTSRTHQVTGLTNTTNYIFQVRAITQVGSDATTRANGAWSGSSTGAILGAPNTPTLTSATGGDGKLTLVFTAPASPISPITGYEYCLSNCTDAGATWTNFRSPGSPVPTSPVELTGFPNGTSYTIRMRAINIHGASNLSESRTTATKPTWTTTSLPTLTRGTSATIDLVAQASVTYSVTTGSLPAGLSLNSATGRISGTPSSGGPYSFTVTATNAGGSTSRAFSGNVTPYWVPTSTNIRGTVGSSFSELLESSNAVGLLFTTGGTVAFGTLPEGLTGEGIDVSTSGVSPSLRISGTPTTAGTYTVTVTFTDSSGKTVSSVFTIEISAAPPASSGSGSAQIPTPTPTPTLSPRPIPRPTANPTPRPQILVVVPRPSPSPTNVLEPVVLVPRLTPVPDVAYTPSNPVPRVVADLLSRPLAYEETPTGQPDLPTLTPRQSIAYENGAPLVVNMVVNNLESGYVVTGNGWKINLDAADSAGQPLVLDESGNLILNEDRLVRFSGSGFAPGSIIKVWLFSDPSELTTVTADENGNFSGTTSLPSGIPEGQHTVQLNGLSRDGQVRSVALGVVVQPEVIAVPTVAPLDFTPLWNLALATGGVALMFFVVLLARKRWFLLAAKRNRRKEEKAELKAQQLLAKRATRDAVKNQMLTDEIDPILAQQVSQATPLQQFPNDSRRRIGAGAPPNRKRFTFRPRGA